MMTLGIVIGITATHFKHVHELAEYDSAVRTSLTGKAENTHRQRSVDQKSEGSESLARKRAMLLERSERSKKTADRQDQNDALLEILTELSAELRGSRAETKALRRQVSESNREIDELTFRVDTHSDSFKPLHSIEDRPRPMNSPIESFDVNGPGLLPPKQ